MLRDDGIAGGGRQSAPRNVLGEPLEICSVRPMTGFYRDGCCNTGREDLGNHTVCVVVTSAFLEYSKSRGNDLSTPIPEPVLAQSSNRHGFGMYRRHDVIRGPNRPGRRARERFRFVGELEHAARNSQVSWAPACRTCSYVLHALSEKTLDLSHIDAP